MPFDDPRRRSGKRSPEAQRAWYGLRVIQALDLGRDHAIDAHAQTALSQAVTRQIVQAHRSLLETIGHVPIDWLVTVTAALEALAALGDDARRGRQAAAQRRVANKQAAESRRETAAANDRRLLEAVRLYRSHHPDCTRSEIAQNLVSRFPRNSKNVICAIKALDKKISRLEKK
jgi:hypothetical protein